MQNISYIYGPVGNITNITNTTTGADGLGGSFVYNYSYNALCRLASRIGGGFAPHPDLNHYDPLTDQVELPNSRDYQHKALALVELWTRQAECAGLQPSLAFAYSLAEGNLHNPLSEPADGERYFYHSDHLGSSAFITTENGYATQFLAYLPFGETLHEEQNSSNYYSPFKFSAKEKDPETGYSYFGARYYSPELSIWLSVDPMSDEYPSLSAYNYCALNPVMLVDPDGRVIIPVHGTWSTANKAWKNLEAIKSASNKFFGDNVKGVAFEWSGGNYSSMRTTAANELINHIRSEIMKETYNGEITLVGHSHGGNVAIEAINMMSEMKEFDGVQINLLSINTPVRDDYQLSENAASRVQHVNIYDPKDPVQSNGGGSFSFVPDIPSNRKGTGEFGRAGRTFGSAKNIRVCDPQGLFYDFHNSQNRVNDWINEQPD